MLYSLSHRELSLLGRSDSEEYFTASTLPSWDGLLSPFFTEMNEAQGKYPGRPQSEEYFTENYLKLHQYVTLLILVGWFIESLNPVPFFLHRINVAQGKYIPNVFVGELG